MKKVVKFENPDLIDQITEVTVSDETIATLQFKTATEATAIRLSRRITGRLLSQEYEDGAHFEINLKKEDSTVTVTGNLSNLLIALNNAEELPHITTTVMSDAEANAIVRNSRSFKFFFEEEIEESASYEETIGNITFSK